MDTEPIETTEVVEDPTIELHAKIAELELIKCKFDAIMKIVNKEEDGGFKEFVYWRAPDEKEMLRNAGFTNACDWKTDGTLVA